MTDAEFTSSNPWSRAVTALRWLFVSIIVLFYLGAIAAGQLYLPLMFTLPLMAVCVGMSRTVAAFRRRITLDLLRRPFRRESQGCLWQFVNRTLCYVFVAVVSVLSAPRFEAPRSEYNAIFAMLVVVPAAVLLILELFPARPVRKAYNVVPLLLWTYLAVQCIQLFAPPLSSEKVELAAPFHGEWVVHQGGRSSLLNHHYPIQAQLFALDLTLRSPPVPVGEEPTELGEYPTFSQPMLAPADGTVVRAVGNLPDQPIGTTDDDVLVGNQVVIEMAHGRFVLLAHLMHDSVIVTEGQTVEAGEQIARCGNSGNTSEPHLHLQVQNRADWRAHDLKTWPIEFSDVTHIRWGRSFDSQHGELMRNDRIITQSAAER